MIKIGIFSESCEADDLSGMLLEQLQQQSNQSFQWFDIRLTQHNTVTINEQGVYWNDVDLCQLKVAFIHGFNYENPVIPDSSDKRDWALWNADSITRQQKYSLLFSLFSELRRRGVLLINPLSTLIGNYMKLNSLDKLSGPGVRAAQFICSNELNEVESFNKGVSQIVWRPSTGRAAWQLFTAKQLQELISTEKPPILLAAVEPGPLRRAYCLDGQVVLLLNQAGPSDQAQLERLEMYQASDYSIYQERLSILSRQIDMPWGEVLFVESDDELVIYDIDPDPPIESLPRHYSEYLSQVLAEYLSAIAEQINFSTLAPEPKVVQRTALFTRRMLRILFDFERSKYND